MLRFNYVNATNPLLARLRSFDGRLQLSVTAVLKSDGPAQARTELAAALSTDNLHAHPTFAAAVPAPLVAALLKTLGGKNLLPSMRTTCAQALCNVVACLSTPGATPAGMLQRAAPPAASMDELLAEPATLQLSLVCALEAVHQHPPLAVAALELLAQVLQLAAHSDVAASTAAAATVKKVRVGAAFVTCDASPSVAPRTTDATAPLLYDIDPSGGGAAQVRRHLATPEGVKLMVFNLQASPTHATAAMWHLLEDNACAVELAHNHPFAHSMLLEAMLSVASAEDASDEVHKHALWAVGALTADARAAKAVLAGEHTRGLLLTVLREFLARSSICSPQVTCAALRCVRQLAGHMAAHGGGEWANLKASVRAKRAEGGPVGEEADAALRVIEAPNTFTEHICEPMLIG